MNFKKLHLPVLFTALVALLFTSCEKEDTVISLAPKTSVGMYVLNEGSYMGNNASVTYFGFNTLKAATDMFSTANARNLGDTGQDMIKYGSKIYIAMYGSSIIEVVQDSTFKSLGHISITDDQGAPRSPRSLTSYNGKVYASLFDGHVAKIDTSLLTVDKLVAVGTNPEDLVAVNNKLYVANSGGMNYLTGAKQDSTVSVIDLNTFTVTNTIKVVLNPVKMKADQYGNIYLISMGNYANIPYTLQRINTNTNTVTKLSDVKAYNMALCDDKAYFYYYTYDANYNPTDMTYTEYDLKNQKVISTSFISSTVIAKTPYSIDVDPVTKNVFIGETDFYNMGKMYCFGSDGSLKYTFGTGVTPSKIVFLNK